MSENAYDPIDKYPKPLFKYPRQEWQDWRARWSRPRIM